MLRVVYGAKTPIDYNTPQKDLQRSSEWLPVNLPFLPEEKLHESALFSVQLKLLLTGLIQSWRRYGARVLHIPWQLVQQLQNLSFLLCC